MKPNTVKRSSVLILFCGVALFADLIPAPGLGNGLIQTITQGLTQKNSPGQKLFNSQEPSVHPKESAQNYISPSPRNDG